ncbi:hypothetical protein RN607_14325 [Demequina capsici]|uniref:Uncharacterized protein n=1 Tax=Demequina capsici TaxID=3075620 RepID=A0AA96FF03_9MICO|nr:hypothetical protein [Demequina sp. PMTSA13]WNM27356.1 hypothetical protein RN607_14325 [Demequina sp. PMTSA13]
MKMLLELDLPAGSTMLVEDGATLEASLNEELSAAFATILASTPDYSSVPQDDLDVMVAESGLDAASQSQVRASWAEPKKLALAQQARDAESLAMTARAALTIAEAADREGVSRSTVSRRIQRRELLTVAGARGRVLLPLWQFTQKGPLPGLEEIIPSLLGADPVGVTNLVAAPQELLGGASIVAWLTDGGDVTPVRDIVEAEARW